MDVEELERIERGLEELSMDLRRYREAAVDGEEPILAIALGDVVRKIGVAARCLEPLLRPTESAYERSRR